MITKKEYIEQQVEGAWEDYKYITQILRDYFTDCFFHISPNYLLLLLSKMKP